MDKHEQFRLTEARVRRDFAEAMKRHGETAESLADRCGGFTADDVRGFLKGENVTSTVLIAGGDVLGVEYHPDPLAPAGWHEEIQAELLSASDNLDSAAQSTYLNDLFKPETLAGFASTAAGITDIIERMRRGPDGG